MSFCPLHALPIGVFDSGVGGLSVYQHLHKILPNEQFVYYADTLNVPYGNKDAKTIEQLTEKAVIWLLTYQVKLIVIACNSASAYTLATLRQKYAVPIVGLVPAIKPATALTKTKRIAVLATQATLMSQPLADVIKEQATPKAITVSKHFDPSLVPWVEQGMPTDSKTHKDLLALPHTLTKEQIDVLVLGCTHYPFFKHLLQNEIDQHQLNLMLIDSGLAIALRVKSLLNALSLSTDNQSKASPLILYATQKGIMPIVNRLIALPITEYRPNLPLIPCNKTNTKTCF